MKLMDKLTGKLYSKVFGKRCDIKPGIKYFDESHFEGLLKEDFSFKNDTNCTLRGGLYHYKNYDKDTLVLFCHGIGGGHQAYMQEINYLAKSGFLVLAFDYLGTILSDGDNQGGFCEPIKDMSIALDLFKNNYKNIYVVGHSWGGFVAQGLTLLHPEIKKIVTLAGMNSIKTTYNQMIKFPLNIFKKAALRLEQQKFGDIATSSAMVSLNKEGLKGLVIQSRDDKILNPKFNFDLVKQCNTNKNIEFLEVNGKNHNPTYTSESVTKFIDYLHHLKKVKDPKDILTLENNTNWDELCTLDPIVMEKIVTFLKK